MGKLIVAICMVGLMGGCALTPPSAPVSRETLDRIAANRPHCAESRQCEAMWAAARNWVVSSCGMKIQTISDGFIETYNSDGWGMYCRVWTDPTPDGGYDFHALFKCASLMGACAQQSWTVAAESMERQVNDAGRLFARAIPTATR